MKHVKSLIVIAVFSVVITSCGNSSNKEESTTTDTSVSTNPMQVTSPGGTDTSGNMMDTSATGRTDSMR